MNISGDSCNQIRDHVPTAPGTGALATAHRALPSVGTRISFYNNTLENVETHWKNMSGCDALGHRNLPYKPIENEYFLCSML